MKKYFIGILCLLWGGSLKAQPVTVNNLGDYNEIGIRGTPLNLELPVAEGSPFLNPGWGKGLVRLTNGKIYNDLDIQFSLINNTLYFRRSDLRLTFTDTVLEFYIAFEENNERKAYFYRSGFPAIDKKTPFSFFEVVADGKKLQLLKYSYKQLQTSDTYGIGSKKEYKLFEQWYVFDAKKQQTFRIRRDVGSLKNALPGYSQKIAEYAAKKKINWDDEEELKGLFKALEGG